MATQLATAAGLKVVGTASSEQGLRAVMAAGAAAAYNHSQAGYLNEVKSRHPNGFDVCIEMLANSNLGEERDFMLISLVLEDYYLFLMSFLCVTRCESFEGLGAEMHYLFLSRVAGADLPLMAHNGRVCVVGSRGAVQINPRDLMSKELQVRRCTWPGGFQKAVVG